jgi:hypothetical protein
MLGDQTAGSLTGALRVNLPSGWEKCPRDKLEVMEEQTVYVAFDGATFSDSEACRSYERLRLRWNQAYRELEGLQGDYGDLADFLEREDPAAFVKRVQVLQELAAFMASES